MAAWNPEETEYLKANYRRLSAKEIAAFLNRFSKDAVIGKAHRLGLSEKTNDNRKEPYLSEYLRGEGYHQQKGDKQWK